MYVEKNLSKNKFSIIVFFKSVEESLVINSDQKRCLKTFIVQDYFHLVILFFEVQLRIFVNFFSKIVDCYINSYAKKRYIYLINRLETILKEKYPEMTPESYYSR